MIQRINKHKVSVFNAFNGIVWAFKTQPNYQIHVTIALIVVFLGLFFNVSTAEWLVLILTISMGLVIETLNTAIEKTTDAITKEWREEIKIAKDVSAAAMLTHAVGAIIIGLIIFIPKML